MPSNKEYHKDYYKRNKNRIQEYQKKYSKKYYIENKGRLKAYAKKYIGKNKLARRIYLKNYFKAKRHRVKELINQFKLKTGCLNPNCKWTGELTPCTLDFHHINPENKSIIINANYALKTLKEEINKCTLVCSNCHRQITYGELDDSKFPICNW